MGAIDDLRLVLASQYPLLAVRTGDEPRLLEAVRRAAAMLDIPVWTWSATRGLARDGFEPQYLTTDLDRALAFVAELGQPGVFVLTDVRPALANPVVVRRLKEIAQAPQAGRTVVLTGVSGDLPSELASLALPWSLPPPDGDHLAAALRGVLEEMAMDGTPVSLGPAEFDALVGSLRGLPVADAERLVHQAAVRDGRVTGDDVAYIRGERAERLAAGGVLELVDSSETGLDAVGGMGALKEWLALRGRAMEPQAARFGLEPPRGVLLTGVPGCGKSLLARALANAWNLPLVLLDPSRLYGPYVGQSEQRLHDALADVEAMAPVVLWIDEIEKGFAAGGEGDGGLSRRVLGTFLRWLQDRPDGIFLVATCNDVTLLPPEFARKGRFDEVFFVDLPDRRERADILRTHITARGRDATGFDVERLARESDGFSGAELEAAVVGAMYRSYAAGAELSAEGILAELRATVPLSRQRSGEIQRLRAWASSHAVAA